MLKRLIPLFGTAVVAVGMGSLLAGLSAAPLGFVGRAAVVILVIAGAGLVVATWAWSTNDAVQDQELSFWSVVRAAQPAGDIVLRRAWLWARLALTAWVLALVCLAVFAIALTRQL